jgi:SAM-dependent methyltransferase
MNAKLLSWEEAVCWLRQQQDRQQLVNQCYYDDPLDAAAERYANSEEWLEVRHLLASAIPGRVLDIGAGRGISSYAFAKAGCQVTALEPDPSSIVGAQAIKELFARANLSATILEEYGETLPCESNSFDIVYGRAVLHHARDLPQLCQESYRVLKPGGIFIATREHVISRREDLPLFLEAHNLHSLYGGEHAYLLQEYTKAIVNSGLKLKKVIGPLASVINYAPNSKEEFKASLAKILGKFLGKKLAASLANYQSLQNLAGWYLSQTSHTPGRHYSFVAVKPN